MPNQSNYYADAGPANPGPAEKATEPEREEAGEAATAELPKTVLGGKEFKPGEEVVLQIVQVMDDSVLVKYATEEGGGEEEAPAEASAPEGGGGNPGNSLY